jgi:hypothetical protein
MRRFGRPTSTLGADAWVAEGQVCSARQLLSTSLFRAEKPFCVSAGVGSNGGVGLGERNRWALNAAGV